MRAHDFLLEYNRQITVQKLGPSLTAFGDPEQVIAELEAFDPTKNKQYVTWLVKQLVAKQFRLEDKLRVHEVLTNFINIKNRLPVEQRDLGRLSFYQVDDIVDKAFNTQLGKDTSNNETGTFPVVPDSVVLYNGPLGQLAVPKTEEASCELGRGTKWCTAGDYDNRFDEYTEDGPLYVWRDKNGSKYQFHFQSSQFMDARDQDISTKLIEQFRTQHPILKKLFAKEEAVIAKDSETAYLYATDVIKGRFPAGEKAISEEPAAAYEYAREVIKGRFPEAEAAMAEDPYDAYRYARDIIRGRFPAGEAAIAEDPEHACLYAKNVIKGRFPKGEKTIASDPRDAYEYARDALKGRFPEGEATIARRPEYAYEYAKDVLKGRFPEAEAAIAKSPGCAYGYARSAIKGRFPAGEAAIATNHYYACQYAIHVIKGRFPEGEKAIKSNSNLRNDYQEFLNSLKDK